MNGADAILPEMTLVQAVILGLIQGITEFLPVSSSGHLVIAQQAMGLQEGVLVFDSIVHGGSLLAIMFVFRSELVLMLHGLRPGDAPERVKGRRLLMLLIIGTIPLVVVGLLARSLVEEAFSSALMTPLMLFVTGALLIIGERWKPAEGKDVTPRRALAIGCAQVLAVLPGLSRSGVTIAAGMVAGLSREDAVRFSFLLSVPALAGATILELRMAFRPETLNVAGPAALIVGTLVAMFATWGAVVLFLRFVRRGSLVPFAIYCWILATVVLIWIHVQA